MPSPALTDLVVEAVAILAPVVFCGVDCSDRDLGGLVIPTGQLIPPLRHSTVISSLSVLVAHIIPTVFYTYTQSHFLMY